MLKFKSVKKIAASISTAAAMLISAIPGVPFINNMETVSAASTCTINPNKTYQSITGFGGINHPEWTGADLSDAQRRTAFGNGDNQLGFTVLRIFVNPDKNQWNKAVPTAKYASQNGVTVFASPWEPPSNLAESGGGNGKLHLPKRNYAAYAQHLNDFGTYMKNSGVNLYSVSVQNEPDYASEWTYWSTDETTDFLANYADKITSTRVMSPESFQYAPETASWVKDGGKKFYTKILNNAKAFANTDLFGTHFYGTQRAWMDFPALESCGKQIWMTEVYVPNSEANSNNRWPEAIKVAENIHNGLVVGNMSAYVWWYIRRSYGPMNEDGSISKRGYCMAQYSKYVRPGAVRIDCTEMTNGENVLISAYKNIDGTIAIVAVNMGGEINQVFNVGTNIKSINRYRTSQSENLAVTKNLSFSGSGFNAQLPGNSVSTFVVTPSGSSGSNTQPSVTQPNPTTTTKPSVQPSGDIYFHDTFENGADGWAAHGTADVKLSGRFPSVGTNALLAENRGSAWCGLEKKLDSSVFKSGTAYSFSVHAVYLDSSSDSHTISLTLQYKDSSGTTKYANIASATAQKGSYVQLANKNYTLPAGSDYVIYVESPDNTDNLYIDEAIGAKAGTTLNGPGSSTPATTTTTKAPSSSTTTTTTTTASSSSGETADTSFKDGAVFKIVNKKSGLCMRVSGDQDTQGNVRQDEFDAMSAENYWRLYSAGNGYYYLMSAVYDGMTLPLRADSGTGDIGVYYDTATSGYSAKDTYQFKLVKNSDGSYKIFPKVFNDAKAIEVKSGSTTAKANIETGAKSTQAYQNWTFESVEEPGNIMETNVYYTFKNVNSGLVMDIKDGKMEAGTNVQQWTANNENCQKWKLELVNSTWPGHYYYIRSVSDLNYTLTFNGTNVELADHSTLGSNSSQFFKFVKNFDGTYTIISRTGTGKLIDTKVLDVTSSSKTKGANIGIYEPTSGANQKWSYTTETTASNTPAATTTTTTSSLASTSSSSSSTTSSTTSSTAQASTTTSTTKASTTASTTKASTTASTTKASTTASTTKASTTASTTKASTTASTTTAPNTTTAATTTVTQKPADMQGDVNNDGQVNIADIIALQRFLVGKSKTLDPGMDINKDGKVNIFDLVALEKIIISNK